VEDQSAQIGRTISARDPVAQKAPGRLVGCGIRYENIGSNGNQETHLLLVKKITGLKSLILSVNLSTPGLAMKARDPAPNKREQTRKHYSMEQKPWDGRQAF
jgi:hypothetical protein